MKQLAQEIQDRIPSLTPGVAPEFEIAFEVPSDDLIKACLSLRDDFGFEMLIDLCAVDFLAFGKDEWKSEDSTDTGFSRGVQRAREGEPDGHAGAINEKRFAVVYQLLSISRNQRLRLKCFCESSEPPVIESVINVWRSADWFEREAFDLYGVLFKGHPDLRRLLTDYGFIGHPFRKDFPLIGNVEVRYDPEKARVVYQPVSIEPRTLVPKVIREDSRYLDGTENEANG